MSTQRTRAMTQVRDDYEDDWDRDWDPQPRQATGRAIPYLRVIADPHTPCWLCEPGYVCAFHIDP